MSVSLIPFDMPAPAEIPQHITEQLRRMGPEAAVRQGMDLLLQIEAAETLVYERVNAAGALELGAVVGAVPQQAAELEAELGQAAYYGRPWAEAAPALTCKALETGRALLVMGQKEEGAEDELPPALCRHMLGGESSGNIGFNYVLPLTLENDDLEKQVFGGLTLLRSAAAGPLNHEQPNLTEALRRILNEVLAVG
jgi:hypothetical protein